MAVLRASRKDVRLGPLCWAGNRRLPDTGRFRNRSHGFLIWGLDVVFQMPEAGITAKQRQWVVTRALRRLDSHLQ